MHIRPATIHDCADRAVLDDVAMHGMGCWLWARMAKSYNRTSAFEFAREHIMQGSDQGLSYKCAAIAELDDRVAGAVLAYLLEDQELEKIDDAVLHVISPLLELSKQAVGTWYVNILAVYAEFRGRGVGAALIDHTLRAGMAAKAKETSLIVEDDSAAVRLYERSGFKERDRRPFVPVESSSKRDGHWVLMVRPL